jgi:manganese/iron transport system permease protein
VSRLFVAPFHAPYMQRALLEILVLSVVAGLVSVHVLLRRLAFEGDALTHTIFPGIAVAFVAGQSVFVGALVAGLASAVLLTFASRVRGIDEDAALGVLIGAFFSLGVVVVSTRAGYTADLTTLLFGRILAVDARQLVETVIVAAVVVAALAAAHKELVFRAFDPTAADAAGYRVVALDLLLNLAVALVVVAAVRAVGTALVIALIVIPGAIARIAADRIGRMVAVSIGVGALCGYAGLVASYEASLHHGVRLGSGATIVLALTLAFAISAAAGAVARRSVTA